MLYSAEELRDQRGKSLMDMVQDARDAEPNAKVEPIWREYAMGEFRKVASAEQTTVLMNETVSDIDTISENLIGQCLNEISARLRFLHYVVDKDDAVKAYLDEFAAKNNLSKALIQVNKRSKTDGNAAMSVSWRPDGEDGADGRVVIHHERWWDGVHGVFLAVADDGTVEWALSDFKDALKRERRTICLPDIKLRYVKDGNGWNLLGDGEGEIEWTKNAAGDPLGVPYAHFANGAPAYGEYGKSTVGQVISVQDALNASLVNRQIVVKLTGMQIYYGTGIPDSAADSLDVTGGTFWSSSDPHSRFGAIAPGNLQSLLTETDDLRSTICGEFPVPSYRLGNGDWPSGLALQRSDFPMIASAKLTGDVFEPGIVLLGHRATELENRFGKGVLNESSKISVEWRPADEVDPGTQVEIDMGRAELFQMLASLPYTLIEKSNILTKDELASLKRELDEAKALLAETAANTSIDGGEDQ